MITAEMANEYNRDVLAFPGKPQDEYSRGCNALIKKNKAHLMESVEDLIYLMGWEDLKKPRTKQMEIFIELDEQEEKIASIIRECKEISIDDLCYRTQMPSSQMSSYLLGLEVKGLIRSLPGKRYVMVG
jgi:DNA processing protein